MTDMNRSMQSAFNPINAPLVGGLANTVGAASTLLFTDLTSFFTQRRLHIYNRHATQTLALILVPLGQAAGGETVNTAGVIEVGPGQTCNPIIQANQRILIVGSAAATTFSASSSDV